MSGFDNGHVVLEGYSLTLAAELLTEAAGDHAQVRVAIDDGLKVSIDRRVWTLPIGEFRPADV